MKKTGKDDQSMKRILLSVVALLLVFSVAACSSSESTSSQMESTSSSSMAGESASETTSSSQDESSAVTSSQAPESQMSSQPEESGETDGILIAYFSWSGNTERMAQMIQTETGGDLFQIEPATPYTEDYNTLLDVAQQEQSENAQPELAAQVENWDRYSTVFVGYPDWWSDAPMVVYSFLESYDWTGKTLIPFCTSGGSGFGRSLDKLPESAPGATILEGLHINGSSVESAGEEVTAWVDSLGL